MVSVPGFDNLTYEILKAARYGSRGVIIKLTTAMLRT
jgi:hypothetical protein